MTAHGRCSSTRVVILKCTRSWAPRVLASVWGGRVGISGRLEVTQLYPPASSPLPLTHRFCFQFCFFRKPHTEVSFSFSTMLISPGFLGLFPGCKQLVPAREASLPSQLPEAPASATQGHQPQPAHLLGAPKSPRAPSRCCQHGPGRCRHR